MTLWFPRIERLRADAGGRILRAPALPALLALAALAATAAAAAPPAVTPPEPAVVAEARALVAQMRADERGPYSRLRWFCKDGSVHPPTPYACAERGGGRQHGEYSSERRRLAELGWTAGTVLAATPFEELWDGERRNQRLRALLVERYLEDTGDHWVLRLARGYRGRIQAEDEAAAGRDILIRLLARPEWVAENYLLVREAARSLPHQAEDDKSRGIRRLAQEVSDQDSSFESLRIKIHSTPGKEDLEATREWIAAARKRGAAAGPIATAERLVTALERLYAGGGEWLRAQRAVLARHPRGAEVGEILDGWLEVPPAERVRRAATALGRIRGIVTAPREGARDGAASLVLVDLSLAVEREAVKDAFEVLAEDDLTRRELLILGRDLVDAGYGAGLLSVRERNALAGPLGRLAAVKTTDAAAADYVAAIENLRRAGPWALGTVRYIFAEALARYGALEPEALRFSDDLLRGSALLPLARVTTLLSADADALTGLSHRVFGVRRGGLTGLNPGIAVGRLRIVDGAELADLAVGRDEVVVLPRTVSDLDPVAGILTMAEGNLLSHVQLLARNLGIPNVSCSPLLAAGLAAHDGEEVLLAAAGDGSVVLERFADLPPALRERLRAGERQAESVKVAAPVPDLGVRRPLALAELEAGLSGRVVGPKAANLGELARHFPGRVAPAIALPFGIFADHVSGPGSPRERLDRAFARHRAGELDDDGLAREIEAVRIAIRGLELSPALRGELLPRMAEEFGAAGSYGVFVRSDTNVEDLPGFTGAGLNETVPHVLGADELLRAVPRVWSSPFTARAMGWRSTLLERPEDVYTSVLLMKSVAADKSGVMVTADLAGRSGGLTVAIARGVGGAVDSEAAETLVLRPDGSVLLLAEAKAPYRRRLKESGGVDWVPAAAGQVLTDAEIASLRQLAAEIAERLRPARDEEGRPLPWDVELGFAGGELNLFQIRPLVERGQQVADRIVAALDPERSAAPSAAGRRVALDAVPEPPETP